MTKFMRPWLEIPMSSVDKDFFTPLYFPPSSWAVMGWGESGGPSLTCALAGPACYAGNRDSSACSAPASDRLLGSLGPILWYGLMANVGYTLGPLGDRLLRRVFGDRAPAAGPVLFRYGFVFSVGLTLLPVPSAALGWLFRFFSS